MGRAKEITIKRIPASLANEFVRRHHYSGKIVNNSVLHLGAFLNDQLGGVMQYGNPIDKRNVLDLVETENIGHNAKWHEMLELNRMAFSPILPKNSESRAIAISIRLIKKYAPHVRWILSFADGTQCGDGTIYRAAGFHLTAINKNKTIVQTSSGEILAKHGTSKRNFTDAKALPGFQLRYIYLIDKEAKLAVPSLPYQKIKDLGAGMYRGQKIGA